MFTFILSVIVLALSLMPCCAYVMPAEQEQSCVTAKKNCCGLEKQDVPGCEDENEATSKMCSPFYACGACAGFTFHQFSVAFKINTPDLGRNHLILDEDFDSEYFNKKWQPPKISAC